MSKENGPVIEPHVTIAVNVVVLLKHCRMLQLVKEGVTRPASEAYSREDDPFVDRIRQAIGYTRQLQHLVLMAQYPASGGTGR